MWKYINKNMIKEFILSLNLIDGESDDKKIKKLYTISNNIEKNYKVYKIKKQNGGFRKICEPNYNLKYIQKKILENILNNKRTSIYATAYKKNTSIIDNALPHINKEKILKLDITNFFDNIDLNLIYISCFSIAYFPSEVGYLLAYLCSYQNHLAQGAVTSPYICNLVLLEFDNEIGSICKDKNISYTRYADDLTFSGDFDEIEIINLVKKRLAQMNLYLNKSKTKSLYKHQKQYVTGLVINEKLNIDRNYKKKIRQEVYYITKFGISNHLLNQKINLNSKLYIDSLIGKINYCLSVDKNNNEFKKYKKVLYKIQKNI